MIIDQITRFPVKGLYGQNLDHATISARGMSGDRRFGIYHPKRVKNRSPAGWSPKVNFLQMVFESFLGAYETNFDASGEVLKLLIEGQEYGPYDLKTAQGRAELCKQIRLFNDLEDDGPLEVIEGLDQSLTDRKEPCITIGNPASLGDLEKQLDRDLGRSRFRLNAWINGLEAWAEHELVGKRLKIGSAELKVIEPVDRCRAINLTPGDRNWNKDDINVHMKRIYGHNCLGLLCVPLTQGSFRIGDEVKLA